MRVSQWAGFVVLAVAVGCACDDSDSGADNVFQVTFDGTRCGADDVPSELTAGSYTFVLTNLDEEQIADFGVKRFVGEMENISEDQAIALWQDAGGDGAYPFVTDPGTWIESAYEDLNAERLKLEANEDQFDYVLEPGSYWMRAGTPFPAAHWRCGFLVVTAS